MRKEQAFALAAAGLLLTGCAKIEQESPKLSTDVATGTTELATEETSAAAQHPSVALQVPEITRQDVSMKLEAEVPLFPTGCSVAMMPRAGLFRDRLPHRSGAKTRTAWCWMPTSRRPSTTISPW